MIVAHAMRSLNLSAQSLAGLPKLLTLPGTYLYEKTSPGYRTTIVSIQAAVSAYRKENPGAEHPTVLRLAIRPDLDYMACCMAPSFDRQTKEIQRGVYCHGCCTIKISNTYLIIWSSYAIFRDRVCSREGYLKHFQECEGAKLRWSGAIMGKTGPQNQVRAANPAMRVSRTMASICKWACGPPKSGVVCQWRTSGSGLIMVHGVVDRRLRAG